MSNEATLKMLLLGEDRSAGKTIRGVAGDADKADSKFQKFAKTASVALAGGLVVAGAAMFKFGQQASDLGETQSKVAQIFGKDSIAALEAFADGAASSIGQSKQAALDGAASFGMFGKMAGLSGKDLVDFSTSLSTLASDMASFGNTSPEEAVQAIGSALRGEAEPIRAYGVLLDDATLKAEAMRLGLLKTTKDMDKVKASQISAELAQSKYNKAVKEFGKDSDQAKAAEAGLIRSKAALKKATEGSIGTLTQQQKVLAAQSAIMRQTKDQQGDFARTSDGLANKQRILKAEFENMTTELGQKALPAMLKLTEVAGEALDWMQKHPKLVKGMAIALGILAVALGVVIGLGKVHAAVMAVQAAGGLAAWMKATKAMTVVQWLWNAALSANPIALVVIAIAALVAGLIYAYKHSETFRKIVDGAFRAIGTAAEWMWDKVIRPVLKAWIGLWMTVVGALLNGAAKAFGWVPGIGGKLKAAAKEFEKFKNKVNDSLDGIQDKHINVSLSMTTAQKKKAGQPMNAQDFNTLLGVNKNSAVGSRYYGGGLTVVGERRAELVDLPRGSRIWPDAGAAGAGGSGGDLGTITVVVKSETGEVIEKKLAKVKRTRGGTQLAFESTTP